LHIRHARTKLLAQKENLLIHVPDNQTALFSSCELAPRVKPKTWVFFAP